MDRIYIVAEIGGNFTTFEEAKKLIDLAKECGVDAVKLQTYQADTVSSKKAMFFMENTGDISQYELFKMYSINDEMHRQVFSYAKQEGIDIFSTPAHKEDIAILEELGCNIYKIGSDDAVNIPFLREIATLNKPMVLATGMCTLLEVQESVDVILGAGCRDLTLLHAITSYPTHDESVNLSAILTLKNSFPGIKIGYSDHSIGTTACICAAAMGAEMIEKHFTYDKNANGPDHILSADPSEMSDIVQHIRRFEIMRGDGVKRPVEAEYSTRINNRKSIVLTKDIKAGDKITKDNIDIKRPGYGIQPKFYEQVLGRTVKWDMNVEDILSWDDLG